MVVVLVVVMKFFYVQNDLSIIIIIAHDIDKYLELLKVAGLKNMRFESGYLKI